MMQKTKKLTAKEAAFVGEYLVDLNAAAAARRAGYSEKTARAIGHILLGKTHIQEAIQAAMNARAERTEITADYVLKTIFETVERCKQAHPVRDRKGELVFVETPSGEVFPAFTFDAAAVLKGAELLGKHLKMFTDKVEHSGQVTVEIVRYGSNPPAE